MSFLIYQSEDGEFAEDSAVRLFRTTAADGKQYEVAHYNLDMILALGFRVRSPVGARFRRWANDTLKEYLIKGFVLDDERLKQPNKVLGSDYFDELSRRLQDIRTSERRLYQKITDTNLQQSATSVDYDPQAAVTQTFFATVQNKLHFAVHGHTAAEQYLIFAEGQAQRRAAMTMQDWVAKLEGFLTLNDRELLQGAGMVSAELAKANAELVLTAFKTVENERFESDFDKILLTRALTPKPKHD